MFGFSIHSGLLTKAVAHYSVIPDLYKSFWEYVHTKAPQELNARKGCQLSFAIILVVFVIEAHTFIINILNTMIVRSIKRLFYSKTG